LKDNEKFGEADAMVRHHTTANPTITTTVGDDGRNTLSAALFSGLRSFAANWPESGFRPAGPDTSSHFSNTRPAPSNPANALTALGYFN
jgi:hypothetical protein